MNPQIKHRYTGSVLFEGEAGMTTRQMLEKATSAKNDLYGADLRGANLCSADLCSANLGKQFGKLVAGRPFFQCGPIGSRSDYLQAFITDKGIVIKAGCFTGFIDEFVAAVEKTHGDTDHGKEYAMAILMIEAHAAIWTPKEGV